MKLAIASGITIFVNMIIIGLETYLILISKAGAAITGAINPIKINLIKILKINFQID